MLSPPSRKKREKDGAPSHDSSTARKAGPPAGPGFVINKENTCYTFRTLS
jgi:hypothetical protein